MAYSNVVYTGNGSNTDFAVPFPFLDRAHVAVTVGGVATSFSWLSDAQVRIVPAPGNGVEVRISRSSNRHARLSNYQDAQVLTEAQMDFDATQLFYVAQEAFDAVASSAGGGDMLRANNLSDVFNISAARNNLGAVAKAGDSMGGPLYLAGSPVAPNEAATKAYVDSRVGAGGLVTSFNTRTGAVTLLGSDVSNALGYTPVNRSGDAMTGFLSLSANPTSPLHAATKQYVDGLAGLNTHDWVFHAPAGNIAAATVDKTQAGATSAYAGIADLALRRTGGSVPISAFVVRSWVDAAITANSDIAIDAIVRAANINGGGIIGTRVAAMGPRSNTGNRTMVGVLVNSTERASDQGRKLNWLAPANAGILLHPDNYTNFGDGSPVGYNSSFGIVFTSSPVGGGGVARTHVPILIDQESVAAGGYGMVVHGGTTDPLAPEAVLHVRSRFTHGIDFRNATFIDADKTAIWLAQGQAIHCGPLSRLYEDPLGNLTFYDSVVGAAVKLSDMLSGSGTNILPLDNAFTGKNTFTKQAGAYPAFTAQFNSGTLSPTGPSIIATTGYSSGVDIRRQSNAASETVGSGGAGTHGLFVQHVVTGALPGNSVYTAIRAQVESAQSAGGGVTVNDVVGVYAGLMNKGVGTGGFGIHVDAYHYATGSCSTYGSSIEMFVRSASGTAIGQLIRNIDDGAGSYAGYAGLGIATGGLNGKGFAYAIKAGLFGSTLPCNYGLDLVDASCNNAAVSIGSNKLVTLANNRDAGPWFRYNSSLGRTEFGDTSNPGSPTVFSVQMSGNARGKLNFFSWTGSPAWLNLGGYDSDPACMAIVPTQPTSTGPVVGSPVSSVVVRVDGNLYRLPLYAY